MTATNGVHTLIFVDSNIWLYAFLDDQSEFKTTVARRVLINKDVALSVQVINEICRNLLKKGKLDESRIRSIINSFFDFYQVVELEQETLILGSDLRTRYAISF